MSISDWAEQHFVLSSEDSAESGRYRFDRAPFQRGILDAFYENPSVVVMSSSQVGKTTLVKIIIGYYIHQDPSPILGIFPTLELAESFSKDRLAPMIRDIPALSDRVPTAKARNTGNTLLHKTYPGGHITLAGANSPASLSMRPVRILLNDEVDRYPISAGIEGDPISIALKRCIAFWNRKHLMVSTPTLKHGSRIELAYEASDKRRLFVPCPRCRVMAVLTWKQVKWTDNTPSTARYECAACGYQYGDVEKNRAIQSCEWRATGTGEVPGFHLSELCSPWSNFEKIVKHFFEGRRSREILRTWVNTTLGETWEEEGEGVEDVDLIKRTEDWGEVVPRDVLLLTVGADVQGDRIEYEVVGWGKDRETWSIDYCIIPGDTSGTDDPWIDLEEGLKRQYPCEDGGMMSISAIVIDEGFIQKRVRQFIKSFGVSYCWPGKGVAGARPLVETATQRIKRLRKAKAKEKKPEIIGVDEGKSVLYAQLRLTDPGPGYCHFPVGRDEEYFLQLTAERMVTRTVGNRMARSWVLTRPRNEALDCRVLAMAAYELLDPDIEKIRGRSVPRRKMKRRRMDYEDSGFGSPEWSI